MTLQVKGVMAMRWNFRLCFMTAAFVFAITSQAMSAEKKKDPQLEAEEKEARAEDEAAAGKDNLNGFEYSSRGKLILTEGADDQKSLVIGVFVADGRTYQVKVEREELRNELKTYNNKEVALAGKIRNSGKYLVVQSIVAGAPPPDVIRNRRGL